MPAPYPLSDYLAKIVPEHATQPNFNAFVSVLLQPGVDLQEALLALQTAFDLDTAIGAQLDHIGEWVNRSRVIDTPLTGIYFSLDSDPLGLDRGIIFGPYSPTSGLTSLDDDHYRLLLRAKIADNSWDGTLPDAFAILSTLFSEPIADPTKTFIFMQDNGPDAVYIGLSGQLPGPITLALLTGGYITLRSMGVVVTYAITSVDGAPLFGLDMENQYVSGLDVGAMATLY